MRGILVFAWFWDYQISNQDNKNVSEIGKTSALTYKKLADCDRVPLSNVPGEVYDDDIILIEIENKQSEKVKNQNPLHIVSEHAKRQLKNN